MNPNTPAEKPRRFKATFIGPMALALLLVMCAFVIVTYFLEVHILERDLAQRSTAVAKLFEQKLSKDTNLMRAVLRAITTNRAVENALIERDRAGLARQTNPLFETLRAEHYITHLYFTGPDLINLYRLHSPGVYGDKINRITMRKAKDQAKAASGLDMGYIGTLTLRMIMPWWHDGRVIGYLEIGKEIEHLIDEIRDSLAVDLVVLMDKQFIHPEQWRRGMKLMQRRGDWERFASHVALAQTSEQLPANLDNNALSKLLGGGNAVITDAARSLHVMLVPISDAGGRHIAELAVIRDITALQSTFRWSIVLVALIGLLVAAAVVGVFYVALTRVERDYRRKQELELHVMRLNREPHRIFATGKTFEALNAGRRNHSAAQQSTASLAREDAAQGGKHQGPADNEQDLELQILRLNSEHHRILQLEKLSALGTMVGGIAHQLNNPLVGVVNMAQLAERETDSARTRELLGEIRRAGEDCRTFVRRMLEFSKASCFDGKPTLMALLIEDTVLMFRQSEDKHRPLEVRLPENPVVLTVDPNLIRHALFNLVLNAAQATTAEDPIVISLEPDGAGWSLAVINRGPVIPPQIMEKVFVPFFTTRSDGTGLGLPVVQHVALLHGGQVLASSHQDSGTRFALWLPK